MIMATPRLGASKKIMEYTSPKEDLTCSEPAVRRYQQSTRRPRLPLNRRAAIRSALSANS